jgi:hypothetical protein
MIVYLQNSFSSRDEYGTGAALTSFHLICNKATKISCIQFTNKIDVFPLSQRIVLRFRWAISRIFPQQTINTSVPG